MLKNRNSRSPLFFSLLFHLLLCLCNSYSRAQSGKTFWREDFSSGKLPAGWFIPAVGNWDPQWIVTDQPYPGSYKYQQQAPPIASDSRGYHLQFQAGYFTDEDVDAWAKKKQYPDGYVVSSPIDCSGKKSVILRFQQKFRYWSYKQHDTAGLFVGVSTDSVHWHEWDARHTVASETDMFQPRIEEADITQWAANQPRVFIRFYWKGLMGFYWMVDDIELREAWKKDIGIIALVSHNEENNEFGKQDELVLRIKNSGEEPVTRDFRVTALLDGKIRLVQTVRSGTNPMAAGQEQDVTFTKTDLSVLPVHHISFQIDYPDDENQKNNRLSLTLNAASTVLGNLTALYKTDSGFEISSGISRIRILFYQDNVFRIWLAPDGHFTDPAAGEIASHKPLKKIEITETDKGNYYLLQSARCALRINKNPIRFSMYDSSNKNRIWEELRPLVFGEKTIQTLSSGPEEYFYGCGMQNGYFSHKGNRILIEKGNGWDDGGRPNPAPFYMSTAGYGVLRNTFDAGSYSFNDSLQLSHNEDRFDAYYFYGPSLKEILNAYTNISGKPFLMPRWALSLGDANCYNKADRNNKPQTTPAVITTVADKYIQHEIPRGWILPNDGYGCGYTKLDSVVGELAKRGFKTGLWTENGLNRIATEVGRYGTRLCKLDVAWVGPGYKYALDACRQAYQGIENNSNERGFVWSVMGWAGTQRYSTIWSGDQSGGWEYIRFHIPTIIGAGLSGFNAASSDIDGIFGGSDSSYTRDLEWKCFIPVFMTMSGWAKKDKQPWIYGDPYTAINRKFLRLKMRLTPYMYSLCNEAHSRGIPATRAMVLEFPDDKETHGKQTQYQFMNGPYLLVAPVYKASNIRDSIYLPAGAWTNYWTGEKLTGSRWLRNYNCPLDQIPLFVKAGAIIPMYPQMEYDGQRKADTLTLDIYPAGQSSFNLYEDDGLSRDYQHGGFAHTLFTADSSKDISVVLHATKGNYTGIYLKRVFDLQVHTGKAPRQVSANGQPLRRYQSWAEWQSAKNGYYFEQKLQNGILYIRTGELNTRTQNKVRISQ